MKRLSVVGSTGSVGKKVLEVVRRFPDEFEIVGLGAGKNVEVLAEQIREFKPAVVSVESDDVSRELQRKVEDVWIHTGTEGLKTLASLPEIDIVFVAVSGIIGVVPTEQAILSGKTVITSNKESIASVGEWLVELARKHRVNLIPADSEHSAVFHIGRRFGWSNVERIFITASGGPFADYTRDQLEKVKPEDALKHPVWNMGKIITVSSAVMSNKGMEVIEAHKLFGVPYDRIDVYLHRKSFVHGGIVLKSGEIVSIAHKPDMFYPVASAMFYPNFPPEGAEEGDKVFELSLEKVEVGRFPMLDLAYEVGKAGGIYPMVYVIANEIAVEKFVKGEISFVDIEKIVRSAVDRTESRDIPRGSQEVIETAEHLKGLVNEIARKF